MAVLIALLALCALVVAPRPAVASTNNKPTFTGPNVNLSVQPLESNDALFDSPRRGDNRPTGQNGPMDAFDAAELDLNANLAEVSVRPFNFKLGGVLRGVRYSRMQQTMFTDSIRPYVENKRELWGQWEAGGMKMRSAFLKSRMNDRIMQTMVLPNSYELKFAATRGTRINLTDPVTGELERKRYTTVESAVSYVQPTWTLTASTKYTAAPDQSLAESFNTWWANSLTATYRPTESLTMESSLSWRAGRNEAGSQASLPAALSFMMAYQSLEHPEISFAMMGSWGYSQEGLLDKSTPYAKTVFNWQPDMLSSPSFHPIFSLETSYTKLPVSFRTGQMDEDMKTLIMFKLAGIPWREMINKVCHGCSPFDAPRVAEVSNPLDPSARRY